MIICLTLSQVFNLQFARYVLLLNAFSSKLDKITLRIIQLLLVNSLFVFVFVLDYSKAIVSATILCPYLTSISSSYRQCNRCQRL